jgi:hypothetical protein
MFDHVKFGVIMPPAKRSFSALAPLGVTLVGEGEPSYGAELAGSGDALYASIKVRKNRRRCNCLSRRQPRAGRCLLAGGWPPEEGQRRAGRPNYHASYYAAFVIAPDGHNIEAVCHLAG